MDTNSGHIRLLLIDLNTDRAAALAAELRLDGHLPTTVAHDADARRVLASRPQLVLLRDLGDALTTIDLLRDVRAARVIGADPAVRVVAFASGADVAQIRYYRAGADQVLPASASALLITAAVTSLAHRAAIMAPRTAVSTPADESFDADPFRVGNVTIDFENSRAQIGGERLELTPMQFKLISALAANQHRIVSRQELVERVMGYGPGSRTRSLECHIVRLRQRLQAADADIAIRNHWGHGYSLQPHNTLPVPGPVGCDGQ